MSGAQDVKTGLTPAEVVAQDIAVDQVRRDAWTARFAQQGPAYDADLAHATPAFATWLAKQGADVDAALRVYWAAEVATRPDINHAHERGGYARLVMLIAYAAERFGFQP